MPAPRLREQGRGERLAPGGAFAIDERTGGLLLVASGIAVSGDDSPRMWERRAGLWTERLAPPVRGDLQASGYDSATGRLYLKIGTNDERSFVLVHEWTSATPFETCADPAADLDGDGLAYCADPDCYWACSACPPFAECRFDLTP